MHISSTATRLILTLLLTSELCAAVPLKQYRLTESIAVKLPSNPYEPPANNKYDHKIDSVGEKLDPRPWRNGKGSSIIGPQNPARQRQNPDIIRPPSTDHGSIDNMRWSFADSHMRIEEGGWARQTTVRELPTSKELSGVNMRLEAGAVRELHWHKQAEWAYILEGSCRITALDTEGGYFVDDLQKGDLWYFPSGHPHSIQGLSPNGTEFLLIFDDGSFSEDSTFLLTDWLAHTPKSVLSSNFRLPPSLFNALPKSERYIFTASEPGSIEDEQPQPGSGIKPSTQKFTHHMLAQPPQLTTGGSVRITDSTNFPISRTVAAAHLSIDPGALREMHWHPNADEWSFFISGRARVTIFGAEGNARTFDYMAGDVGIVPRNNGHFIENLSDDEPLEVLEIFRADKFEDFSLMLWMGATPERMVADTLFQDEQKEGRKFLDAVRSPDKDPIRGGDDLASKVDTAGEL